MTLLVIIHVFICVFLVAVILLQPGKGDAGVGFGSSSQSIFGSKGASNFLTKTTTACAILFLVTSFLLTRARIKEHSGSVMTNEPAPSASPAATPSPTPSPAATAATPAETKKEAPGAEKK